MNDVEVVVKAEDIAHVLREGTVLLPGCRDLHGRALLIFPAREHSISPDHMRNVLLYLYNVTADEAKEKGLLIIVDMRGKQTGDNVKKIMKAINNLHEVLKPHKVLVITSDKFWEKSLAKISVSSSKCEVVKIPPDQLIKYVEPSQLLRELGGTFAYDHDEWLDLRLELEKWIWQMSDVMRGLEAHKNSMENAVQPVDVPTATAAIERHKLARKSIRDIPTENIQKEANRITEKINRPRSGITNPDLISILPNTINLISSLHKLAEDVYNKCEARRIELDNIHQLKVFEQQADNLLGWIRSNYEQVLRYMGDVGSTEQDAREKLNDLQHNADAANAMEVTVNQVVTMAGRLRAPAIPGRNRVEQAAIRVDNEWLGFQDLLDKRRQLLSAAATFFGSAQQYFEHYSRWIQSPGVDPDALNKNSNEEVASASERHQQFWSEVEQIYLVAADRGAMLKRELENNEVIKELSAKLNRAHRQLHGTWKERKVRLDHLLAMYAFYTDAEQVMNWLQVHGFTYLNKVVGIGDDEEHARVYLRNHTNFRKVARNTYENADKIFEVGRILLEAGVGDVEQIRNINTNLHRQIEMFNARVEPRFGLLNQSVLFHTHYNELMTWYTEMERKYAGLKVDCTVAECEASQEAWMSESDGTANAYATTIGDGQKLLSDLLQIQTRLEIDYSQSITCIRTLMGKIDNRNQQLTDQWGLQRVLLQVALRYAHFAKDCPEVVEQMQNWEADMAVLLDSPNFYEKAGTVGPYHETNKREVKAATKNIKRSGEELIQTIHGQQLDDMMTKKGDKVLDLIRNHLKVLVDTERRVFQIAESCSARIALAIQFCKVAMLAKQLMREIDKKEQELAKNSEIPEKLEEASEMFEKHEAFSKKFEMQHIPYAREYYDKSAELLSKSTVPYRTMLTDLYEEVYTRFRRLHGLIAERAKLLKAAIGTYKTYHAGVVPILDFLEKEYSVAADRDWCKMITSGETPQDYQERIKSISDMLSRHHDYKCRFQSGCSFAQKNTELFLKYLERSSHIAHHREYHEQRIMQMKADLRDRQSRILDLWVIRKKDLDRCHHYLLVAASLQQLTSWLTEGEEKLRKYERKERTDGPRMRIEQKDEMLEDFLAFKLNVKEERARIQAVLVSASQNRDDPGLHKEDLGRKIDDFKRQFGMFSARMLECEKKMSGKGLTIKDEISLDRHSDNSVEEKMEMEKKEQKSKTAEPMRELIRTEETYVENLGLCIRVCVQEYDRAEKNNELPPALRGRRRDLFSNIEDIYEFHQKKFLRELTKYVDDPEEVGCSFTVWVDLINELYTEYCGNYEQSKHVHGLPEVVKFFSAMQEKHKCTELHNNLNSLLIQPVQRITRYLMILEKLLKYCTGNLDGFREALEVVTSIPRRANDMISLNGLDREKLGVLGPFVMQDCMTVWEPRAFKRREKERQVFLFELVIVIAKKIENSPTNITFIPKGKPIPLGEVLVVEHVEGDPCRFGLRVKSTGDDNRTDLRAANEATKVAWIKRIREFTQALLEINLGGLDTTAIGALGGSVRSVSTRSSNMSTSSGDRHSRDGDSLSTGQRNSIHSIDSNEQVVDEFIVSTDFEATVEGQLTVRKGERVEAVESEPSDSADWLHVSIVDDSSRSGLVPCSILLPDQPSSSAATDRPDASAAPVGGSNQVTKRKSLRRIFANSGSSKEAQRQSSPQPQGGASTGASAAVGASAVPASNSTTTTIVEEKKEAPRSVLSVCDSSLATAAANSTDPLEGLPPPMEELTLNNSHMNDESESAATETRESVEEEVPEKAEKTPEELARFKRHYVLKELVETEQDYVRDLTSVVEGYIANLEKIDLPEALVGKDRIIFANISNILDFHKNNFLKEIEKCMDNYEAAGSAFVKYERRLHSLYVTYCQNKPKSDYLVSQDDFELFFAETKLKLGHKVALCDLLIKPVQRIMKYQLLLKDILKFTERAKDSTVELKKALDVMHVVPKACDDMMQVGRLQNFDGSLNAQGRLIYQGTLSISESQGGTTQKPKDRRIFLFEQSAIFADHIPPKKEYGNPTYIFKNQIMVNKMMFESTVSDDPLKFIIRSSDPAQSITFVAISNTQEEKDEWVRKIGEQLDQQKRLLAALVDPKRYMGGDDISGGMNSMNIGGDKKSSNNTSFPRFGSSSKAAPAASKAESPKRESKNKLFSFGKKSSPKSPTSPPPVGKLK